MRAIYEVHYEVQWQSSEPTHWESFSVRAFSDLDALDAVEKVKRHAMSRHRLDENGREERSTGFRLREVLFVAEAEL